MTDEPIIHQVMESLGFTDGTNLPIANEQNKKLLDKINELTKERSKKEAILLNIDERTNNLNEHYKNAQTGIEQNLKLLNAYRIQANTENNMFHVSEREISKMKQELKNLNTEVENLNNYDNKTESEIKKISTNIEKLTNKIEWSKNVLCEWKNAMDKSEETNKLIEQYCKDDEHKAQSLANRNRKLQEQILKRKNHLIIMFEEQKSIEIALDRTAQLYRQTHNERRTLVSTWKDAVKQMNTREEDIEKAESHLEYADIELEDKRLELKEQEEFLNELITNNKEVDIEIFHLNEEISDLRKRLEKMSDNTTSYENQVNILRKQVQNVEQQVQQQLQRNNQIITEKSNKEIQISKNDGDDQLLNERFKKLVDKHLSTQERLNILEEMINNEEKSKKQLIRETSRIDTLSFRTQQQLIKLQNEEKLLMSGNQGIDLGIIALNNNINEKEKQIQSLIEADYNVSLRIQLLEMRKSKLQGVSLSVEELIKQQNTIHQLELDFAQSSKLITSIQAQIDKLDRDMKKLNDSYNNDKKVIDKLNYKIKDALLYVEGGIKDIKNTHQANQKKIVDLSILKMRVHEMELQISRCDNKVYSLEKHRIHLDRTIKERMLEIKIQMELLTTKRKHLLDMYGTLKCDLSERDCKINAFKKRYEIAIDLMGKNDDGSIRTATQLKIESAQERQMLLHDGNELNEKVLKAEKEIKAMENTLCLLNFSNDKYRQTFERLDTQNPEYIEFEANGKAYCEKLLYVKSMRNDYIQREKDLQDAIQRRDEIEKDIHEQTRVRTDNSEVLAKLQKDLLDQKVKIERAERDVKCTAKALRHRSFNKLFMTLLEKDIILRELEDKNNNSLQLISDFLDTNDDLTPQITELLTEKGLKLPQLKKPKSTTTTWRSDFSDISFPASKGTSCSSLTTVSTVSSRRDLLCLCPTPSILSMEFLGEPICKSLGPCEFPLPSKSKKITKSKKK